MNSWVERNLNIFDGMAQGFFPAVPPDSYPKYEKRIVNKDIYLCVYSGGDGTLIYNSMTNFGSVRVAEIINLDKIPKPCTFFYLPVEMISVIFNTVLKMRFLKKKQKNNTYYSKTRIERIRSLINRTCALHNVKYTSESFEKGRYWDDTTGQYSTLSTLDIGLPNPYYITNARFYVHDLENFYKNNTN